MLLGDEDVPLAGAVGLPPGETAGVAPGLAEALPVGVELAQFVLPFCVVCFVLALAPVLALALDDADALDVAVPLVLLLGLALLAGLVLLVALVLPLDSPREGLTVELGDAPDEVDVAGVGLDEAGVGVGEAAGDNCGHDAAGDGR